MARDIRISGIFLHANATRCYHTCRYCQLPSAKPHPATFARYAALVDRFIDWRNARDLRDFEISEWYGNSHDYDHEIRKGIRRLSERQGSPSSVVLLGGVAHRSMHDMKQWLRDCQEVGIHTVVASFPGRGERHDYWNGRSGNYAFQLSALRLAADMGMSLQERLFLIRDTVGDIEQLIDDLNAIATDSVQRWSFPLFYSGLARRLESERLTQAELDSLPQRVKATFRDDSNNWRSEHRWISYVRNAYAHETDTVSLVLRINDATLAWAEARSCDQIVEELAKRWRTAYAHMPSRLELSERYGDIKNDAVYMFLGQMERVWLDRYLKTNIPPFDIADTYFSLW
jgi:hypothetical protein